MSRTACLVALAALSACIEPAVQGTTVPDEQTSEASTDAATTGTTSSSTDPTASDPTTGGATTDATSSSTGGPAPTCSDDQLNQDESDVDCGGACPPCDGDAMCNDGADCTSGRCDAGACFPLHPSCLQLLTARPGLPSGAYPLDPDGDGANPLPFFCDMDGGGWTQVFLDEFDGAPNASWEPKPTAECGPAIGLFLGPFGTGETAALPITAQQVPHSELRLVSEVVIMDSWDPNEDKFVFRLDGAVIFEQTCDFSAPFSCGQSNNLCGNAGFNDSEVIAAPAPVAHAQDAIGLEFTSTLLEAVDNEAWGLDKVVVFVK
jgi:hypothetical protein